ncbi:hypothetical protein JG687_00009605 [Phytophthora cactorum]|uniref:Uncharacterized protein n=1 Tax=Phytophthora cactorum TaxID=29920 RepID=A0A8T1UB94_9STRA|nr:hypothetical protein JG687_00009605 [Phytophthora cactorum]
MPTPLPFNAQPTQFSLFSFEPPALNPPSSTVTSKNAWSLYFVAVALLVSCNGGASTTTETKLWTMTSSTAVSVDAATAKIARFLLSVKSGDDGKEGVRAQLVFY